MCKDKKNVRFFIGNSFFFALTDSNTPLISHQVQLHFVLFRYTCSFLDRRKLDISLPLHCFCSNIFSPLSSAVCSALSGALFSAVFSEPRLEAFSANTGIFMKTAFVA